MPSLYAHEIFHSWNVKRLRPADLWPYQYAHEQPTPWLWVSEGITDYYADLAEVRGGVIDSSGFFGLTLEKIGEVADAPPVSLEDASLSTWVHPVDGTGYLYYAKGSLAGLLLDIMIRDGSDNHRSLDDVMRQLYQQDYRMGRGFTADDWWRSVAAAAGSPSFEEVHRRYIDGRDPFPWRTLLPIAGMRIVTDTVPRLGINTVESEQGLIVTGVDTGGSAAKAGLRPGDVLLAIGDLSVTTPDFVQRFTDRFRNHDGASVAIRVRRGPEVMTLNGTVRLQERMSRLEAARDAVPKAVRIRAGILHGTVDR
jgi:predicted metalloprotease with PDZ domain